MGRRKTMDLSFGADVMELDVPLNAVVRDIDGKEYDFAIGGEAGGSLGAMLGKAFILLQSKNERRLSRQATNQVTSTNIRSFLNWASQDRPGELLSQSLLVDYKGHVFKNNAASTAVGKYGVVAACAEALMQRELIPRFSIPIGASASSIEASKGSRGESFATTFNAEMHVEGMDDYNEKMLKAWVDAAWSELETLFERIETGRRWRAEARSSADGIGGHWPRISKANMSPQQLAEAKEAHAKKIIQSLEVRFGGYPFGHRFSKDFPDLADELPKAIAKGRKIEGLGLSIAEIASYFHPSPAMVGLAISLLSAAQVNPVSAAQLDLDCLADEDDPGMKRLKWRKGRAGGDQPSLPFPVGSERAKTIPRLIERFVKASSELRALMPQEERDGLFVWTVGSDDDWAKRMDTTVISTTVWVATRKYMADEHSVMRISDKTRGLLAPFKGHFKDLTPSLIRRTALNVSGARLGRDFKAAASLDGRKSERVLESSYLSNAATRHGLDEQVREGQASLAKWVAEPIVLAKDEKLIATELDMNPEMAKMVAEDEFNLGMGASLIDGRTVFIDTPINALRVIQWLDCMEEAKARMLRDSPGRWRSIYEPQIDLFTQALQSFSRKNRKDAQAMAEQFQLPFPSIH